MIRLTLQWNGNKACHSQIASFCCITINQNANISRTEQGIIVTGHYTPQYTALVNQVTSPTENETADLVTEKMLIKQS